MTGDLHTHSIYDDGKNSLLEMAEASEDELHHSVSSFLIPFLIILRKFDERDADEQGAEWLMPRHQRPLGKQPGVESHSPRWDRRGGGTAGKEPSLQKCTKTSGIARRKLYRRIPRQPLTAVGKSNYNVKEHI